MEELIRVSFPGLGIGEFEINKIALHLFGDLSVRWYGIIITCAIIVGFLYAHYRSKHEGISTDDLLDYAIYTVIFSIIGARAYYVISEPERFDSFYDVIAIWNGGIAIYGAIIAGALSIFVISKIKKIKPMKALDMVAPGVMIAQSIGRWGNFFNGEAHGGATELFCRMGLSEANSIGIWSKTIYVHPTFLYESLWNLVGFIIINIFYKKKKFDGQVLLMYITWYGFGRMLIEGLRTDSLYFMKNVFGETIRVSQMIGALCFVVGMILLIVFGLKARRARLAEGEYEAVYDFSEKTETGSVETEEETEEVIEEVTEITEEKEEDEDGKDN